MNVTVAKAPEALLNLIAVPQGQSGGGLPRVLGSFEQGNRNAYLTSLGGFLRRRGAEGAEISHLLRAVSSQSANPLSDHEIEAVAYGLERYAPALDLSEQGLADLLAERIEGQFRYVDPWGWMRYTGTHWERDPQALHIQETVKKFLAALEEQLGAVLDPKDKEQKEKLDSIRRAKTRSRNKAIHELARSDPRILDTASNWDQSQAKLNFLNGTLCLKSWAFNDHDPDDRIDVVLPYDYDPAATCPLFDKALATSLDKEVADFLLRVCGYSLLDSGHEQFFFIHDGYGSNGKSKILGAVEEALGGYAGTVDPSAFLKKKDPGIGDGIASMRGKRLVFTSELNQGQVLDASMVKRITGGDKVQVRRLYENFFTFTNRACVMMLTNHPPIFDGGDFATRRRLVHIPWSKTIAEKDRDPHFAEKLREEKAGIMNRLLEGLRDYQTCGLALSDAVVKSTAKYAEDNDQVGLFLKEECELDPQLITPAREMHNRYWQWAYSGGLRPMSAAAFKAALERKLGTSQQRSSKNNYWPGVGLKTLR